MKKLKQIQNIWVIGASVTFCFTFLIVNITAGKVNAQGINSPSTNSQSEALAKSASNGVVLINQKSALAGKITPGDTPGFPVTISQSGSYSLSSNLTVPANTNGIEIQADNVTIDLNGFSITGNGSGDGITDNRASHTNITIRNGIITNFNNGISLGNFANPTQSDVEQIHVSNNGNWGILVGGSSIVSKNIASNNGLSPTSADFGGIGTTGNSTISGNIASANKGFGILASGPNCTISGNTADGNSIIGIVGGGTISGNTASNNSGNGISAGTGSTISGNTASINQNFGILATCPSNIVGNTAQGNTNDNIVESFQGCTRANNFPAP